MNNYKQKSPGKLSRLKIITVIDVEVFCKMKNSVLIKYYRTTLTLEKFIEKFFNDEYEDGMLLTEIYGKENIIIQQKSKSFQAVHGFSYLRPPSSYKDLTRKEIEKLFHVHMLEELQDFNDSFWDDSILLTHLIYTPEEIKTILTKELGFVAIRNYGVVSLTNLDEFTGEFYKVVQNA